MAALGVLLDGLTWMLPHRVVWKLQLRHSHKIAISAIFAIGLLNIVIGGLRLSALTEVAYGGDVTYGIGTTLMWSMAQMSTGIIVACCPHLRPLFEKILPSRLTRVPTRKSTSPPHQSRPQTPQQTNPGDFQEAPAHILLQPRQNSITVTTRIEVSTGSLSPNTPAASHDGHLEPWSPTFDIEAGPADGIPSTSCCVGCLRRGSCC
ncbi:hypothetical protein CC86DRAFT_285144 [Ophiobolus disseminans]|uniref:Rhodopsin domain-containing protein n=1 Tax=Ophiobolus disseminans TaxID=1469910 RepID=A0A6A7A8U4_9PLEO|nr:hypothetical protein CC86DRAFT_285144 [Ophiobolus disseminans]